VTTLRVGRRDAGRRLSAAQGDEIVVSLDEVPGTGLSWSARSSDPAVISLVKVEIVPLGAIAPGGSSLRTFTFHALHPGEAQLSFDLSFAGSGTTREAFTMTIIAS
jgi:hypothetical protein